VLLLANAIAELADSPPRAMENGFGSHLFLNTKTITWKR
jgi:hypothetical protein